jgi:hypothetical protein
MWFLSEHCCGREGGLVSKAHGIETAYRKTPHSRISISAIAYDDVQYSTVLGMRKCAGSLVSVCIQYPSKAIKDHLFFYKKNGVYEQ